MRKIIVMCFAALMTGYCQGAEAGSVLTERQLDAISAGAFDTDVSEEIIAQDGALVVQKNAGVIKSLSGDSRNNDIINANRTVLRNEGTAGVTAQANIGVIRLGTGLSKNNDIRNTNTANLRNRATELPESSVDAQVALNADESFISGTLAAASSAASAQSNIGMVLAETGEFSNTGISNRNDATVRNRGDSALAMQINTGLMAHLGAAESSKNNDIRNTNTARIDNIVSGGGGFAEIGMGQGEEAGGNFASGEFFAERSAAAAQTNIAAVIALGTLVNADINNRNRATVRNRGDSALAMQENIAVAMGMGQGENNNNDINNRNNANVNNRVTDESGSITAVAAADTDPFAATEIIISAQRSAVAGQSNLSAVIAAEGTARNSDIANNNRATVRNRGDSALAIQSNIGVIACLGEGANKNNDIRNTNAATVNNRVTDTTGGVEASFSSEMSTDSAMNTLFSKVASLQSAVATQHNIAAIVTADRLINSSIRNRNTGHVNNSL